MRRDFDRQLGRVYEDACAAADGMKQSAYAFFAMDEYIDSLPSDLRSAASSAIAQWFLANDWNKIFYAFHFMDKYGINNEQAVLSKAIDWCDRQEPSPVLIDYKQRLLLRLQSQ